jgi:hypothetical protein
MNASPLQCQDLFCLAKLITMVFSVAEAFMASTASSKGAGSKPSPLRFNTPNKNESSEPLKPLRRANTFQNGSASQISASKAEVEPESPDAFDTVDNDDGTDGIRTSVDLDELPIELISLTDR